MTFSRFPARHEDTEVVLQFGEQTLPEAEYPWREIIYECLTSADRPDSFRYEAPNHYFIDPESGDDIVSIVQVSPASGAPDLIVDTVPLIETLHSHRGLTLDHPDTDVTSDGATVEATIQKDGGGDLRYLFSDGVYTLDCTTVAPCAVALTPGTDTAPTLNYIYILKSTGALTASTAGWPATEYAPVLEVYCQSAASVAVDGPYKSLLWADHIDAPDGTGTGHIGMINGWIRAQPATWISGGGATATGGVNNLQIATVSGEVRQLHVHPFAAIDMAAGDSIYVANDSVTPFNEVTSLHTQTLDSAGVALDTWYTIVIWGVVNCPITPCKLFCNLPSGSYLNDSGGRATNDDENYSVYDIPSEFIGSGFLISAVTVSVAGTTWTIEQEVDLRGNFPGVAAGGGSGVGAATTEYLDSLFRVLNATDDTKKLAFDVSGITTGTTRTITVPDEDFTLIDWTLATEDLYTSGYIRADHIWLPEQAASPGSAAGNGLLWVKNTTPCELWYTDDAGTDFQLGAGGGGGMSDLVDDLTPELGGTLDALTNDIDNVGFMGIGVTAPSTLSTLHVKAQTPSSTTPTLLVEAKSSSAFARVDIEVPTVGVALWYMSTLGNVLLQNGVSAKNLGFQQDGAGTMTWTTNAAENMRIHTNGYVGINVSAPARHLHVDNDGGSGVGIIEHSSGAWSWLHFMDSSTTGDTYVGVGALANNLVLKGGASTVVIADGTDTTMYDRVRFNDNGILIKEIAAAAADVASFGQIWVKNTTPNELWFTDDAGTDVQLGTGGSVSPLTADLDGDGFNLDDMGVLFQREQASADADVTAQGQWWVRTATPNTPMFTDDAGTDHNLIGATGTFSPSLEDTSHNPVEATYTRQDGSYTLIGDMVYFTIDIVVSSLGTLSTGSAAYIGNLPFTSEATYDWAVHVGYASSLVISSETSCAGWIGNSVDYITLQAWDVTTGMSAMTISEFSSGGQMKISGMYRRA